MLHATRKALLSVEALICFGIPTLLALSGLPLLFIAVQSLWSAGGYYGDLGGLLGIVFLFVGGALGITGAAALVRFAIGSGKPLRRPRTILFLVCSGMAALAAATAWFDLNVMTFAVTLAGTLHFVHIARANFIGDASTVDQRRLRPALRDVALASLLLCAVVGGLTYRIMATGLPVDEQDPCLARSGGPGLRASFHVDIREADWPAFSELMSEFAQDAHLSMRDGGRNNDTLSLMYLSLCNESGTHVLVNEQRWRMGPEWDWTPDRGVSVPVYARAEGSDWRQVVETLEPRLEEAWPGQIARRDLAVEREE